MTTVTAVTVIDIAVTVVTADTTAGNFFPFIAWEMSGKGEKNRAAIYQISKQGEM